MKFRELTCEEFKKIEKKQKKYNFYQTVSWANVKKTTGWESYYVGVFDGKKNLGIALLLAKKILNKKMFYIPRGPLLDYDNFSLLEFFFNNLKLFVKSKGGFTIKIDPYILYQEHDRDGNPIGESNDKIISQLKSLGFVHRGFTIGYTDEAQFRWSYVLNIKDKKFDDLKKDMNQRCRRCLKMCYKYPLVVREVNEDNFIEFKKIMEHTANRQNHFDRSMDYYKNLAKYLGDDVVMVIVYLDKEKYLEEFKDDKLYEEIKKEQSEFVPITAGVFMYDWDRLNYAYGGTYSKYMHFMAQYRMQFEMIKRAMEKKLPLYDFGGISGDFNPDSDNYGVYEFKRGFGGNVVEYIGEFDLVVDKLFNSFYKFMFKTYRGIKKIRASIKK